MAAGSGINGVLGRLTLTTGDTKLDSAGSQSDAPAQNSGPPNPSGDTAEGVRPVVRIEDCVPALRRYALALLRDRDRADDLVHDCLVLAFGKQHTRREDAGMRAWLFTILHNVFVSQRRRQNIRPDSVMLDETHSQSASQRANQEDRLLWRDMLRGLDALPEEQRSVVLLVSVEDLSYAETAAVLGVPVGTVMSRLSRGREKLRQSTGADARPALRRVK